MKDEAGWWNQLSDRRSVEERAVKIVDFLQGKWLGHSLHPAVVHLPVGLWTVACGLDIAARAGFMPLGGQRLALYCVGLGLIGAVLAVPTGWADWSSIKRGKPAWKLGLIHLALNALATMIWTVNFWWRFRAPGAEVTSPILVTSLLGTALVFAGGYVGGLMVFDHGVSVARLSKKKWRTIAVRGGANVPSEKE